MLNIVFMGTPDLAKRSLQKLHEAGNHILAVVTTPDKQKGRGMKYSMSPVKEYALEQNFTIYQPEKIRKNEEFLEKIQSLQPDVICVVAYGKILPKSILNIPTYGCVNLHPSLLPKYRGPAPIQWAILNGDTNTGITTMYMDEGMDTGDIILQQEIPIGENETTGELWQRVSEIGSDMLVETIKQIEAKTAPRKKQEGETVLAPMLEKEMAKIEWENKTAKEIKNLIRGLNPIMGAYTYWNGKKVKFWEADTITEEELIVQFPELQEYSYKLKNIMPGTVLFSEEKKGLYIKTKQDILKITQIQAENAKRMPISDFLRGNQIETGTVLE